MKILEATNISKTYLTGVTGKNDLKALKKTTISFEKGSLTAIIGRSGSGKSTLLHCLGGLDEPTTGTVLLEGQDIYSLSDKLNTLIRRRRRGRVFQFDNLLWGLTG